MHKWIGCILIVASCTGIGFSRSMEMQRHLDELEELKKLFYFIKSELQHTRAPFSELFERIGKKTKEPFSSWLLNMSQQLNKKNKSSFWEVWCETIDEDLKEGRLKKEELEELKHVGKNLEYIEQLELYIEQLEYITNYTRESEKSKRKLCQSMGIMSGIFLVILLL